MKSTKAHSPKPKPERIVAPRRGAARSAPGANRAVRQAIRLIAIKDTDATGSSPGAFCGPGVAFVDSPVVESFNSFLKNRSR